MARKPNPPAQKDDQPGTVKTELVQGVATEMWLELLPYSKSEDPKGHVRSLWLLVDGIWLSYDDPDYNVERAVLSAFSDCADRLQVRVWYYIDYSAARNASDVTDPQGAVKKPYNIPIVGLVVNSK